MINALRWGLLSWLFISCLLLFWTLSLPIVFSEKVYRPLSSSSSASTSSSLVSSSSPSSSRLSRRKTFKNVASSTSSTELDRPTDCVNRICLPPRKRHLHPSYINHLKTKAPRRKSTVVRGGFEAVVIGKALIALLLSAH